MIARDLVHRSNGFVRRRAIPVILIAAMALPWSGAFAQESSPVPATPIPVAGFTTAERAYLTAEDPTLMEVLPVLSAGDTVGEFQMAGSPSGIGGYIEGQDIFVFVTHALTTADGKNLSSSRLSRIVVDKPTGTVREASYVIDGSEGYELLGGTVKASEKAGLGDPLILAGEATTTGEHGGVVIGYEPKTSIVTELPWLGHMTHLGIMVVPGFTRHIVVLLTDGSADGSELYMFTTQSREGLLRGDGQLWVFVGNGATDATGLAKGGELTGRFAPIPASANTDAASLQAAATAAGAFQFARLEGIAWDRNDGKQTTVYLTDSGKKQASTINGRVYTMTLAPDTPTEVSGFKVLLDGDAGDDIRNPASLNNNKVELIIGESLKGYNQAVGGTPARIRLYTLVDGTLKTLATVDEFGPERIGADTEKAGNWEPVGLLNGGDFYGHGSWFVAVQAHSLEVDQFGAVDEGGQLLVIRPPKPAA